MSVGGGMEYFWMCQRVMHEYLIPDQEVDEVLAHSIYLAFVLPYPLSYSLIRWCVLMSIKIHCGIKKYPLISFSDLDDSWIVLQPEIIDDKVVYLEKFRKVKNTFHSSTQPSQQI